MEMTRIVTYNMGCYTYDLLWDAEGCGYKVRTYDGYSEWYNDFDTDMTAALSYILYRSEVEA